MPDHVTEKVAFLIKEYEKLKDEQRARIDFRDRMTFITLGAVGGVFSFVVDKPQYLTALLVLPFVCIVLGWTYIRNDQKISAIGEYCRKVLIPKIDNLEPNDKVGLTPSWEEFHKMTKRRKERKLIQLIVDMLIFCASAFFSIGSFFYLGNGYSAGQVIIVIAETVFILYLGYQFVAHFSGE